MLVGLHVVGRARHSRIRGVYICHSANNRRDEGVQREGENEWWVRRGRGDMLEVERGNAS